MDRLIMICVAVVVFSAIFRASAVATCDCQKDAYKQANIGAYNLPEPVSLESINSKPSFYMVDRGALVIEKKLSKLPPDTLSTYPGEAKPVPVSGAFEQIQILTKQHPQFVPDVNTWHREK